jgi:hypothetical protein
VACLRAVTEALGRLHATLEAASLAAHDPDADSAAAVAEVRRLLAPAPGPEPGEAASGGGGESVAALVEALAGRLASWEGIVQSRQAPSRVLQWSAGL